MNKLKEKTDRFFQGRHGLDELGKCTCIVSMVLYLLGGITQNGVLLSLGMVGFIWSIYRAVSKQEWDRNEENRKYTRYLKLWKVRWQERKTSRIYMCKSCGRMIRVPKGKGKIQVTCPSCGSKKICRS